MERAFPDSTTRGNIRKIASASLHTILTLGPGYFIKQAKDKIEKREFYAAHPLDESRVGHIRSGTEEYIHWLEANEITDSEVDEKLVRLGYDVLVFPVIDWDVRFQRPQQLCIQFANNGHRVFYIRTTLAKAEQAPDRPRVRVREIRKNIYEAQLTAASDVNIWTDPIISDNLASLMESIDQLISDFGIAHAVSLVEFPTWTPLVAALKAKYGWKIVHDRLDRYEDFSTVGKRVLPLASDLCKISDLVIATSSIIYKEARRLNRNTVLVRNAADFAHFSKKPEQENAQIARMIDKIRSSHGTIVGYYGAIADWFDTALVRYAASHRPDWAFVLLGRTAMVDVDPLRQLKNVYLLGEQRYDYLPQFLHAFDVCIIPFQLKALTEAADPVKVYEYLSAGKPVVSVPLPEVRELESIVHIAKNKADFVTKIEQALRENGPSVVEKRIEYARKNTWRDRFQTISESTRQLYPKATLVVPTYNNVRLLRLCLRSIFEYTEYPNYEVIVVDNASTDGTVEYLSNLRQDHPELEVLLEKRNTGFAPAVNKAIRTAYGEYVAILNDDVILTRGWLTRLVGHLERDPSIALIGPLTDSAGNEARCDLRFSRIAELQRASFELSRKSFGTVFPLRTLAMFCTVMRKSVMEEVGPLDERFSVGMFEDDDYSYRVRLAGYRIACAADVFVHHTGRASFGKMPRVHYRKLFETNRHRFEEKWKMDWIPHRPAHWRDRIISGFNELQELLNSDPTRRGVVIFLEMPAGSAMPEGMRELGRSLATRGFKTFFISGTGREGQQRCFSELTRNEYAYAGPLEVFDATDRPILVAVTQNAHDLIFFRRPCVIFWSNSQHDTPGLVRSREGLLEKACLVIADTPASLSTVSKHRPDALLYTSEASIEDIVNCHLQEASGVRKHGSRMLRQIRKSPA